MDELELHSNINSPTNAKIVKVAIDGPAASGKSTTARMLASYFNYRYIDSGAIYRAITWEALQNNWILPTLSLSNIMQNLKNGKFNLSMSMSKENGGQTVVLLNGKDISLDIRTPLVNQYVSEVAKYPEIREEAKKIQKTLITDPGVQGVVMDGRDIGSVIIPDAQIKIFLIASAEVRAKRRYLEMQASGSDETYESILRNLIERDKQDEERAHSPLVKCIDAIEIDTSCLSIQQQFNLIKEMINKYQ